MAEAEFLRDAVSEALQRGEFGDKNKDGFLLGFFFIAEVATPDGDRWLNWGWSEGLKTWQMRGYMHEALDGQIEDRIIDEIRKEA